ncbi:nickel transporter permease [Infirmifilum sp. NZ]|uniref:nickel transporter permease n=1 Tax=Infirmifilum sp. NZ TaxID=2926850 RepID=UPI00279A5EF5|nr:nickel transporter permease [Infirmifilum sp. NZ]UNQ73533.1 ABC transporter permease [Infirmifilum sp. NZ]
MSLVLLKRRRGAGQRRSERKLILRILMGSPAGVAGLVLSLLFIVLGVVGPHITPYDPILIDFAKVNQLRLQPPSLAHPFGTDEFGRDMLSRVLYGSRLSLLSAVTVLGVAVPVGIMLGLLAGYFGGAVDELIMRITDVFLAFPGIVLAIAFSATLGAGLWSAILAVALIWWPSYVRLVRGQVIQVKSSLFVEAAKALGLSPLKIMIRHLLPNILTPVIVMATLDFGSVVIVTSSLSFIGLGAQPPLPEWGRLVSDGRAYFPQAWWYVFFPGLMIFLVSLGWNLLGDTLRDVFDPKYRRRLEFREVEGE